MSKHRSQFESIFTTRTAVTKERRTSLQNILKSLFLNSLSLQFRDPLDWKGQGLINYNIIIKKPMDLTTVKQTLKKDLYHSVESCLDNIELIFQNSRQYNKGNSWIEDITDKCEKAFLKLVRNYFPQVGTKDQLQSKKTLKRNKMLEKQDLSETIETSKKKKGSNPQDKLKLEESNDETTAVIVPPMENSKKDDAEIIDLRLQLFNLIHQASQKSLQVTYLIIKNQDTTIINTQSNGNCSIDVKTLSKKFLLKLIAFLKDEKVRQDHDALKENTIKRKRKIIPQKSRYEV